LQKLTLSIIQSAVIASVYTVFSVSLGPLGYSWVQLRIGEALTPLPFIFGLPAVAGLTIGCVITNLASPVGIPDLILGSALTLIAAILSWKLTFGKPLLACVYPVIVNAVGVSAYISAFYGVPYIMTVLTIGLGEFIVVVLIGYPTILAIRKWRLPKKNNDLSAQASNPPLID
jgi:uncharacterized membrane protein